MVEVELKKWGNSLGVILPMDRLRELGLHKGDKVEIDIIGKNMLDGFGMCRGAKTFQREPDHREEEF
jgi:antitoxin component of MazEF toxin-antitoxin module